jgi:hypothetical protein
MAKKTSTRFAGILATRNSEVVGFKRDVYWRHLRDKQVCDLNLKLDTMRSLTIFSHWSDLQMRIAAPLMRLQRLNFGRTIVTRGEPSTKLFFLAEGEVRLSFRESHSAQEISATIASAISGFNAHTNDKMEAFKQQHQQEASVDLHGRAVQSLADSGEFPKISSAASSDGRARSQKAKPHVEKKNHAKQNKVEQEVNTQILLFSCLSLLSSPRSTVFT